LEKLFKKWSERKGRQAINIDHIPDSDKKHLYFVLSDNENEFPFKLGLSEGSLNGNFLSDFVGNCVGREFCYWARKMKTYTKDNYEKGLADILNESIKLYKTIKSGKKDLKNEMDSITRYTMSEMDKIREVGIRARKLGMEFKTVVGNRWRAKVGEIEVLITFGITSKICPIISVISPRIALGGNVSFGGLLQFNGLTPKTWDGNLKEVPERLIRSLKDEQTDIYSDESYKLDELRASKSKFFTHKLLYGLTSRSRNPILEVGKDFYNNNKLSSSSYILIERNELKGGPYTPIINESIAGNTVLPPAGDFMKIMFARSDSTAYISSVKMEKEFQISKILSKDSIKLQTDDYYNIRGVSSSGRLMIRTDNYSYSYDSNLRKDEISLTADQLAKNDLAPGDKVSVKIVEQSQTAVKVNPSKIRENSNKIFLNSKLPVSKNFYLIRDFINAGPVQIIQDSTLPVDAVGINRLQAESLGIEIGEKVDLKLAETKNLGSFKAVNASNKTNVIDTIEVSDSLYDRLLANAGEKFFTLAVETGLGIRGSYITKLNPRLAANEIGLQGLQLINLNIKPGNFVNLELTELQQPAVIGIRPRRRFREVGKGNIYKQFRRAFDEYTTLSTGHTISLKLSENNENEVDIIYIKDAKGNEMHTAYMRQSFREVTKEVELVILPSLQPAETALDVDFAVYSHETEESSEEEAVDETDFQYKSRSPEIIREKMLSPFFGKEEMEEYERSQAEDSGEEAGSAEEDEFSEAEEFLIESAEDQYSDEYY